jgi:EAL and modified HD-GYP domain-containing signal transduction protein
MPLTDVVVGRQPIVDRRRSLIGYELLFRLIELDPGAVSDGQQMTTEVLFGTLSLGVHELVGDKLMFCNAERGVLTGRVPVMLPPEQTVIEVLETVEVDDEVLDGCHRLAAAGYRLALDDFTWTANAERLLPMAWVVKVDVLALEPDELDELYHRCRSFGALLLAEKVETEHAVDRCRQLGFDLFQGYAVSRPERVTGRVLDAAQLSRVRLAATLLGNDLDLDEVERIARTDPGLVYQLLQVAAIGRLGETRRPVHSIRDALVLLGTRQLQNWLAFLLLRTSSAASSDELTAALVRAQTCELLAARHDHALTGHAFTAGLISTCDTLLGATAPQIASTLALDDQLRQAAFGHSSRLGRIVHDVISHESGDTESACSGITARDLDLAAARAFHWATQTIQHTGAAA